MSPESRRPRRAVAARPAAARALATTLALAATLAACGPGTPSPAPSGAPSGSGAAACPTAPSPPPDLPGWDVSAQSPTVLPVLIASPGELTCGRNRILFSFVDRENNPVAGPDRSASIALYVLGRDGENPIATVDGTFVWAVEDRAGIYVAYADLPEAGAYGAEFVTAAGGEPERIRLAFDVQPSSPLVKVGQLAPATTNPTLADVGGDAARISTDADPLPSLYESTPAEALAAGKPFVLAFATPKFCVTAQCGPTLDRVKPFVERYPDVAFINVEPYRLKLEDGGLQADLDPVSGQLVPVEATVEWGLLSEPWVFVVDGDGVVVGSFGLVFSDDELAGAIEAAR